MRQRRIVNLPHNDAKIGFVVIDVDCRPLGVTDCRFSTERRMAFAESSQNWRQPVLGGGLFGHDAQRAALLPAELLQHRFRRAGAC